jgi:hypothetical protein
MRYVFVVDVSIRTGYIQKSLTDSDEEFVRDFQEAAWGSFRL